MKMDARTIETQLRAGNAAHGRKGDYITMPVICEVLGLHRCTIGRKLRDVGRIGSTRGTRYYIPHVAREICKL